MGIKERRAREKALRKEAILLAAKDAFFENGFQATTMEQIAQAAELSKGTVYLYFQSKEELYVSLLKEGLELLYNMFARSVAQASGWEAKVRQIGHTYFEYSQTYNQFFHINFQFQHGEITANISDALFQDCFEQGFACLDVLAQAINEGIQAGDIAPQDPMESAIVAWGSLTGVILLYEDRDHRKFMPTQLENLIAKNIDLLVTGLKHS